MNLETSRTILNQYNAPHPLNPAAIKRKSKKLLTRKLCKCIRAVDSKIRNRNRAIGICTKTVINRHKLVRGRFSCKRPTSMHLTKRRRKPKQCPKGYRRCNVTKRCHKKVMRRNIYAHTYASRCRHGMRKCADAICYAPFNKK
jgi:hypothetical protein